MTVSSSETVEAVQNIAQRIALILPAVGNYGPPAPENVAAAVSLAEGAFQEIHQLTNEYPFSTMTVTLLTAIEACGTQFKIANEAGRRGKADRYGWTILDLAQMLDEEGRALRLTVTRGGA